MRRTYRHEEIHTTRQIHGSDVDTSGKFIAFAAATQLTKKKIVCFQTDNVSLISTYQRIGQIYRFVCRVDGSYPFHFLISQWKRFARIFGMNPQDVWFLLEWWKKHFIRSVDQITLIVLFVDGQHCFTIYSNHTSYILNISTAPQHSITSLYRIVYLGSLIENEIELQFLQDA